MANIGVVMNGGKGKKARDPHDYYPTPSATTRAVWRHMEPHFPKDIWECACGTGHISRVLQAAGCNVINSDIVARGVPGAKTIDFLKTTEALAPAIITNPPFKLGDAFIEHALSILGVEHLALILPITWYNAAGRAEAFDIYTPSLIMPFTWRIDSTGEGSPTMNLQWVVWSTAMPPLRGFFPLTTNECNPGRLDPLED